MGRAGEADDWRLAGRADEQGREARAGSGVQVRAGGWQVRGSGRGAGSKR